MLVSEGNLLVRSVEGKQLQALILELRRRSGISKLRKFAKSIGVSHSTVSRWESGEGAIGREGRHILSGYLNIPIERLNSYLEGKTSLEAILPGGGAMPMPHEASQILNAIAENRLSLESAFAIGKALWDYIQRNATAKDPVTPETIKGLIEQEQGLLKLEEFAASSKLELTRLQAILSGDRPTDKDVIKLARALNQPTEELFELRNREFPTDPRQNGKKEKQTNGA
ncbi:MAG TPA: helix-turn-helix transcriptional regulator [Allocoleopsis sp.]